MIDIVLIVAGMGAFGGLVACLMNGQFDLPRWDRQAKRFNPGWIGTVIVGAVAAGVLWGLYGPLAHSVVAGDGAADVKPSLRLAEFFGALVTGIGGSAFLAAEVKKRLLQKEKDALSETTKKLAASVTKATEGAV